VEEALAALSGARSAGGRSAERHEEQRAAVLAERIEQVLAHTMLSCEAVFGQVPESLAVNLRQLFERELLHGASDQTVEPAGLDAQLESQKRLILGEMAQGMAGRFKNVLNLIIGRVQFLRMVTMDEKVCGSLDIMENASLQGLAAVRRVEDFSEGAAMRVKERLSLRRVLDDALEMVRVKREDDLARAGKHLRIIREFVGSPAVMGCETELRHAFVDVLLNGLDAMPDGGVLTVSVNQSSDLITVMIADTGCGMSSEAVERAFDPQFSTKGVQGAGLGLPIARAVVERHDGKISLESQVGRGTTAAIHLPAAPAENPEETAQPAPASPRAHPAGGRVLVVDDEPMVCDLMKDILGAMGCEVLTSQSGPAGLEQFARGKFDLIMTDLAMPGMNGWEVAREIRTKDAAVPVALFSAWGAQMDAALMRDKGVDFLFPKPFEISMIRNVLISAMELGRERRTQLGSAESPAIG